MSPRFSVEMGFALQKLADHPRADSVIFASIEKDPVCGYIKTKYTNKHNRDNNYLIVKAVSFDKEQNFDIVEKNANKLIEAITVCINEKKCHYILIDLPVATMVLGYPLIEVVAEDCCKTIELIKANCRAIDTSNVIIIFLVRPEEDGKMLISKMEKYVAETNISFETSESSPSEKRQKTN